MVGFVVVEARMTVVGVEIEVEGAWVSLIRTSYGSAGAIKGSPD